MTTPAWIVEALDDARLAHPTISDAARASLSEAMRDSLSKRTLTSGDVRSLADLLLGDGPSSASPEAANEA